MYNLINCQQIPVNSSGKIKHAKERNSQNETNPKLQDEMKPYSLSHIHIEAQLWPAFKPLTIP